MALFGPSRPPRPLSTVSSLARRTTYPVLAAIAFAHLLNDTVQQLIPAIYPLVKTSFHLSYGQIGLITLTFQATASLLQPFVGHLTDRRPQPFSLIAGMCCSLIGVVCLAWAGSFSALLVAVALVGVGSSIFHPEASRMAFMASGGKRGLAQSVFQLGGNTGSALGPLLAALIIMPRGQSSIALFVTVPLIGIAVLWRVAHWYRRRNALLIRRPMPPQTHERLPRRTVIISIIVLLALVFSKQVYLACMTSFYTFFLMDKFHLPVQTAQMYLFAFLLAAAAGTLLGGPIGDRYGRRPVIWASILGAAPFTLALPFADLFWTGVLSVCIGFILASAFSAILVHAQELLPGRVGLVAGLFFGFAFGMAGIGSAVLGELADHTSIDLVYRVCAFLPLIGVVTILLPKTSRTP
jgi:MFS transporter, FSR family, fosmidomycin resistance protein